MELSSPRTSHQAHPEGFDLHTFELLELLEHLAALTPRSRINFVLYHGVLAPHSRWRDRAVSYGGMGLPLGTPTTDPTAPGVSELQGEAPGNPRSWTWADLMGRAFELDVLTCPRCGGRIRVIATIEDPRIIHQILSHLGLPTEGPRPPPTRAADLFSDNHA